MPNTKHKIPNDLHDNNKSKVDWIFFKFTFVYDCIGDSNEDLTIVIYTHFGVVWIFSLFFISFRINMHVHGEGNALKWHLNVGILKLFRSQRDILQIESLFRFYSENLNT